MMASSEVKKPPVESTSWSFIDTKPGIAKYDVKHTHVVTIGNISEKMKVEHGKGLLAERFHQDRRSGLVHRDLPKWPSQR